MSCGSPPDFASISPAAGRSGLTYPPTPRGNRYLSTYHHRGSGSPEKNVWLEAVPPPEEYGIFWRADCGEWRGSSGSLWGLLDGGDRVLGTRGQRLCFFPAPSNRGDDWHGYPLSPADDGRNPPPQELIEKWKIEGTITRTWARRAERGVI